MSLTNVLLLVLLLIMLPVLLINELIFDPVSGPIHCHWFYWNTNENSPEGKNIFHSCTAHPPKKCHHNYSQIFFMILSVLVFCILFINFIQKFVIEAYMLLNDSSSIHWQEGFHNSRLLNPMKILTLKLFRSEFYSHLQNKVDLQSSLIP